MEVKQISGGFGGSEPAQPELDACQRFVGR